MATTGERIRQLREEMKMTQDQLAAKAKISKSFLCDIENHDKNISSQGLLRIANTLGASVDYLLRGKTVETKSSEPVVIPSELSEAAAELDLSYAQTLELLNAYNSVVARRSNESRRGLTVEGWKSLHQAIKDVIG